MKRPPPLFNFEGTRVYVTDGCSGYVSWIWSDVLCLPPVLRECCEAHDRLYWLGVGSRLYADKLLFKCMFARSLFWFPVACLFFVSIRIGGVAWLPFSWRWGYRKPWLA